ncbi:MAG: RelA/SpoT family protein, partial [Propionibacteriaceae bacterium]
NMRTIGYLRPDKQARISRETLEIFAPLAHRLGMNAIKWELEDLSFSTMQPKVYDEIVHLVAQRAPQRDEYLRRVITEVQDQLTQAKIKATVYGRPKHYYSIYQKMVVRGRDFSDIYDLIGLRVLVDSRADCYAALGVMHVHWSPLPGRFKDYIAMPKFNLYQSLHTTVLGPEAKPVELQIRTHEMHRMAEYGVAAHWKYKEGGRSTPVDLNWVSQLRDWQRESTDPGEFLDDLRFEISADEVYAFTPKGEVFSLPAGSTPVDFAYSVHTQVGQRCIGARVNGRLVPLDSALANGDVVEILTSKAEDAGPSRDWLAFVKSPRARNKIRRYFSKEQREESLEQGKDELAKQLRRQGLPMQRLLTVAHLTAVAESFHLKDIDSLYTAIGDGTVSAQAAVSRLITDEGGFDQAQADALEDVPIVAHRHSGKGDSGVEVDGDSSLFVKLAKCCTPVPGDDIIGWITRMNGVSVHRSDCTNVDDLMRQPERLVPVSWSGTNQSNYLVAIQVEGLDRSGMLADITRNLAEHKISITSLSMLATKDRIFRVKLTFETPDPTHLKNVLANIRKIDGVYDVYRIGQ